VADNSNARPKDPKGKPDANVTMTMILSKNFRARNITAAFIGVLGILGAQRERVWANDLAWHETIYDTDFIAAAVGGLRNTTSAGINLSGISGPVTKAYLYWHGPMNSTNPLANATIRVNNQAVTGVNIGFSGDNGSGYQNSQAYRAEVTSLVRAERNGVYFLSQFVKQGTNVNANGASLLVFFNDGNPANNRDIVLFDGNDSNADNPYDALGWSVSLAGIHYSNGRGFIQLHVSDGQYYEDAAVTLNGMVIEPPGPVFQGSTVPAANEGPGGTGRLWDVKTYEVTSWLAAGADALTLTHGFLGPKGDGVSLIAAAINLPAGAAPVNNAPVITGASEVIAHSPNPIVVQAEVSDADGDPLTCTICLDGTVVSTTSTPAGSPTTAGSLTIANGFGCGQHTVLFTANDGLVSRSFTTIVRVIDDTPPALNVPANIIAPSAPGQTNAVVHYTVTATDDFPGVTVLSLPPSGSAFPIGTTTVTAVAVDASGNRTQRTFTVTVTDCLPPTIRCPQNMLRPTDPGASNAVVYFSVSATDNLPGCTITCTPASGSVFQPGITTVVCLGRDAAGNTSTCMFFVTVTDQEPPILTVPTNLVAAAAPGLDATVVEYTVTTTDASGAAAVNCTPPSGATFPLGMTTVTCTATDDAGNSAMGTFTVTVIDPSARDVRPPVIAVPGNLIVPTDPGQNSAVAYYTVTVIDDQPGAAVLCTPLAGSVFPVGVTTVVCHGIDTSGNQTMRSFTVTVEDREKPVLNVPANMTVVAQPGAANAIVEYIATATDNSGSAAIACVPPAGTALPIGVTTVTCAAIDDAANVASSSFTVTVINETQPPALRVVASRAVLWPPNHKLVPIHLRLTPSGGKRNVKPSSVRILSVTSNEPETGLGPDDVGPDWEIVGADKLKLRLRAERDDHGSDRVYIITVEATDPTGNVSTYSTTVMVPIEKPGKKRN
jgi:hypothetical protein